MRPLETKTKPTIRLKYKYLSDSSIKQSHKATFFLRQAQPYSTSQPFRFVQAFRTIRKAWIIKLLSKLGQRFLRRLLKLKIFRTNKTTLKGRDTTKEFFCYGQDDRCDLESYSPYGDLPTVTSKEWSLALLVWSLHDYNSTSGPKEAEKMEKLTSRILIDDWSFVLRLVPARNEAQDQLKRSRSKL